MHKMCSDERKCAVMKGCLCSDELRRNKWFTEYLPRQPPAYALHRPDGENRRLGMGIGIEGEPHSKPQLQVTPPCIPQFATMKRNWWPNAGPIVEGIRRGDIAQITCGTEPLMMGGEGCGGDFLYDE